MPAGGAADGEAALFKSLESETETGVVDAQALAQDGPGERLAGAAERGAHCLGEGGRQHCRRSARAAGHRRLRGAAGGERERSGARR